MAKYKSPDLLCSSLVTLGSRTQPLPADKCHCVLIRAGRHNSCAALRLWFHYAATAPAPEPLIHGVIDLRVPKLTPAATCVDGALNSL